MRRIISCILVIVMVSLLVLPATAAPSSISQIKKQTSKVNSQLSKIGREKKEIKNAIEEKKDTIEDIERDKALTEKQVQQLKAQKQQLDKVARQMDEELKKSIERYNAQRELLGKRIKVMYENSNSTYLQTLVESKSITDFFQRFYLIALIAKSDKQLIESLKTAKKDVEYKKSLKEKELQNKQKQVASKQKEIQRLNISRADVNQDLREYELTLEELEKQEDELIRQATELNRKLKSLMSKGKYSGGKMRWPVPSSTTITSSFGMRYHPVLHKTKMHTGVDIAASSGTSIVAAGNGRVIVAEYQTGYGNTVVIDHGGDIATRYAHCSRMLVGVGETVHAGQTIAKVGSTGWSTGPHLHFEVIKDGEVQNPMRGYLSR